MVPPPLFFFLRIAVAMWGLLWFCIKFQENIGSKILDIGHNNIVSDISPQARKTKEKINKLDYIKLKSFA